MEITDKQIDSIFDESPFISRRTLDKRCYEVVENTSPLWRTHIPNDGWIHHGFFVGHDEAETHRRRLHVRWVLNLR